MSLNNISDASITEDLEESVSNNFRKYLNFDIVQDNSSLGGLMNIDTG